MGVYKKAVITDAGRALMARSTAGEAVMQFSRAVTSSYIYPSETDFKGYISLEEIQQAVIPSSVQVVNDTLISVRSLFGNESISESYLIQNIGLYATDGNEEILFSVSQAATPDEMPVYNGAAPSSFIYTIQATVSQASSLSMTINPAGTATTQDIVDLDGAKLDSDGGDISETVIETLETPETEFPVPSAGESTKGFMGKVRKFIQDFNAFKTGIITLGKLVNNGQTTEAGFALDARYGKTLADAITQLNANLVNKGIFCRASNADTSVSVQNGAWKAIGLDVINDGTSDFTISSRRIVFQKAGIVIITANASFAINATGDRGIGFEVNGLLVTSSQEMRKSTSLAQHQMNIAFMTKVSVGTALTLQVYQNSGSALDLSDASIRMTEIVN